MDVFRLLKAPFNLLQTLFDNFDAVVSWLYTPFVSMGNIPKAIITATTLLFKNSEIITFRPIDFFGFTLFILLAIKVLKKAIL